MNMESAEKSNELGRANRYLQEMWCRVIYPPHHFIQKLHLPLLDTHLLQYPIKITETEIVI